MAAASPIVADLAGERFAALADAAAVGITAGLAAIDDGRAAEFGPFLPGGVGNAVGGCAIGIAAAGALAAAAAARQGPGNEDEQKDCWQPVTERVGGTQGGRLPANTNIDGGGVEIHV
jgi:hypothetical protein